MAAHRYWRVYISSVQDGSNYVSCMELEMHTSIGGASVCTGGTASASSDGFGWVPANAFDGSTAGNGWHSGNGALPGTVEWLKYDFGSGNDKDIVEFSYASRATFQTTQAPRDFQLQYSDDNSAWTTLIDRQFETAWTSGQTRTYSASNTPVLKQIWRLNVTAVESGNVALSEFKMHTAVGGADVCTGGAAAASSVYSSNTYSAEKTYDSDIATFWSANSTPPQWIQYVFAGAVDIVEIVLTAPPGGNAPNAPKTWTLQYFDPSGSPTWQNADSQTSVANWTSNESRTYTFGGVAAPFRGNICVCT
jgi:hypothetical protein